MQVVGPRNRLSIPGMDKKTFLSEASGENLWSLQPVKKLFFVSLRTELNLVDFVYRPSSSHPRSFKTWCFID